MGAALGAGDGARSARVPSIYCMRAVSFRAFLEPRAAPDGRMGGFVLCLALGLEWADLSNDSAAPSL